MNNNQLAIESFISFCDDMMIADEKLETNILDKTLAKSMYLYHGSDMKLDIIKPTSLNMGTRLSSKRTSSFWTTSIDHSFLWAMDLVAYIRLGVLFIHDIENKKFILPDIELWKKGESEDSAKHISECIKETLNNRPVYIYGANIPMKYIGRGQVPIDEYTVDIPVRPDQIITITGDNFENYGNIEYMNYDDFMSLAKTGKGVYQKEKLKFMEKLLFRDPRRTMKKRTMMYKTGKFKRPE